MRLVDLDLVESGGGQLPPELLGGEGTSYAAGPLLHVSASVVVHVGVGDDVGDGEATTWSQNASGFAEDGRLVGGEVNGAVADDHVDGAVGEWDVLDRPLQPVD